MTYNIYHPLCGELNSQCKTEEFIYEKTYVLEADSLEQAVKSCRNNFNEVYTDDVLRSRNVEIGDIIQSDEDMHTEVCHIVCETGFQEIKCKNHETYIYFPR